MEDIKKIIKKIPHSPGVYLMKDENGKILYIGKAGNLNRRVSSYFLKAHDARIEGLVSRIKKIDYIDTPTALEALILEASLIKKHSPPFNIREKDDKSFLYVCITKDEFPRIILTRGKEKTEGDIKCSALYGPFTSASQLRQALKTIRKIFPWSTHPPQKLGKFKRPCLSAEIGLCPGTCVGDISKKEYAKNIRNIKLFFAGKKAKVEANLKKEMEKASKNLDFELADKIKRRLFALSHIRDTAFISESEILFPGNSPGLRIEGYDISNISGTSAVGAMVVFKDGLPDRNEYRKFKIRTIHDSDDVGMMREVVRRRFKNDWPLPDLLLVDGGKGQVNAVKKELNDANLSLPVVGIAKGPERKRNDIIGRIPKGIPKEVLVQVRDEAHRFAIKYHRSLARKEQLK